MHFQIGYEFSISFLRESQRIACLLKRGNVPGLSIFGKTPLFFRYSGVNAGNAVNLQAKRR